MNETLDLIFFGYFPKLYHRSKNIIYILCLFIITGCINSTNSISIATHEPYQSHIKQPELLEDFEYISSPLLEGRATGTRGSKLTQQYLITKLKALQIEPLLKEGYIQEFTYTRLLDSPLGENILGKVKGTLHPQKYIVISAHYDHLGKKYGEIYLGADDNASGVAALLSFAREIKRSPLAHSVIFLFTDAEEQGLKGSKAYILQNPLISNETVLNINIDMIAGDQKNKTLHYLTHQLGSIISINKQAEWKHMLKTSTLPMKKGFTSKSKQVQNSKNAWLYVSDHGAFYQEKIPFVYYGVNPHKNYHSTQDTYANANKHFLAQATQAIFRQLQFLDNAISAFKK